VSTTGADNMEARKRLALPRTERRGPSTAQLVSGPHANGDIPAHAFKNELFCSK
jgi:hypothetical protein